jgi:hypothetical protein
MDIEIFFEFALPLVGATVLIIALERLYQQAGGTAGKEKKARYLNL